MTTALLWPEWVLTPGVLTPFHVLPQNSSGGQAFTGSEQIVGNSPGRARIGFGSIAVDTAEQQRVWQTIALNLAGRLGTIMVPAMVRRIAPWPTIGTRQQRSIVPKVLTDDILFSDGSDLNAAVIAASAASAAAAGDVEVTIALERGADIRSAQVFQAGEYAYPIRRVLAVDGNVFTCALAMPLREAIAEDAALNFDSPRFRARLEDDTPMPIDLALWKNGTSSLVFVEDV
jgi:hypothetical protein